MIVLDDDTLVHTIWFITDKKSMDYLGVLMKQKDAEWGGIYRFRHYRDNKAFDSEDEKNWYTLTAKKGSALETLAKSMGKVARMMGDRFGLEVHTLFINGTGVDAYEALKREGWAAFERAP